MDYSLLVAIHRLEGALHEPERDARLASLVAQGGYVSVDRKRVFFFGIIDILERELYRVYVWYI